MTVGDQGVLVGVVGLLAVLADLPAQPLGEDEGQRGGDQEGRDAHVEQPRHRGRAVVGVQRGEHEVAGERGADADLRRLQIAGLADQDDVGVLAEEDPERGRERAPDARR